MVVNFIAVLELCRESLVEITQAEPFALDLCAPRLFAGLSVAFGGSAAVGPAIRAGR